MFKSISMTAFVTLSKCRSLDSEILVCRATPTELFALLLLRELSARLLQMIVSATQQLGM